MDNKFSSQLTKLRKKEQLSQTDLASKVFVTRQSISKWERGEAVPDLNTLLKLTEALSVDLNELVFGTKEITADKSKSVNENPSIEGIWNWLSEYWLPVVVAIMTFCILYL
ncbi:helix-turn-helix transcriptional regulator [Lentilactobacillus sp. Marseille-Q4993]|uniref:helix-turn-helix domain-containing protein n=1 Tax=Lentilactobacillus sp. Marseille-Q4993 TaxID=3039492 RepID=UPI0024BC577B|nr:helix-turn-helix transcriptional regulator [Lentilactobacillus sp. Marseille-Q4993]